MRWRLRIWGGISMNKKLLNFISIFPEFLEKLEKGTYICALAATDGSAEEKALKI